MHVHRTFVAAIVVIALAVGCSTTSESTPGTFRSDDARFQFNYPTTWSDTPVTTMRTSIESGLKTASGSYRTALESLISDMDRGEIRAFLTSQPTSDGFTESIIVQVEEGDADIDSAVSRRIAALVAIAGPIEQGVTEVNVPLGEAIRVEIFSEPPGASPSHLIEYVIRIRDGRTVSISGTGPSTDETFSETMRLIAETVGPT